MSDQKHKIATWMREVLDRNGWTAKDWATRAHTSPTTITRFLGQQRYIPSGRTLNKLASAANSVPPIGKQVSVNIYEIPLMRVIEMDPAKLEKDGVVVTTHEVSSEAICVVLDHDTMTLAGMLPGDELVCEPLGKKQPRTNAIIAYYDGGVCAGRFFAPFIIPASSNAAHKPVSVSNVHVIGKVVQQIRIVEPV